MGELAFRIIVGACLIFIVIRLIVIRRGSTIVIDGKRISLQRNLTNHLQEYQVAVRDVDFAQRLLGARNTLSWIEMSIRLSKHGKNPALVYLGQVTSELQAEDMFMAAHGKLIEVRDTAKANLDLARSLVPNGAAEAVMNNQTKEG